MRSWAQVPITLPLGDPVAVYPYERGDLRIDQQDRVYTLRSGLQLVKRLPTGKIITTYSTSQYGTLTAVDPTNPLQVLLFYKDFNTIVYLDNEFSELGIYQLALKGFTDIGAIGYAQDGGCWLFDNTTLQLKKIDRAGNVLAASENLLTLGLPLEARPNFILARNNFVYVNAPNNGIYVFDLNGAYYRTLPITGLDFFQIRENHLWYWNRKKQHLVQWPLAATALAQKTYRLPYPADQVRIGRDYVFLQIGAQIQVFEKP